MVIRIEPDKFFKISLIAFIVIEIITWFLSQFDLGISFIKGGFILILFGLVILFTTLWQFGTNINSIKLKDVIFMFLVLGLLVALYLFLPQIVPQLFSIIPGNEISYQFRDFLTKTIGSIANMGTGIV